MNKARTTLNRFAKVISRSTQELGSLVRTIWRSHQEFMNENPSYRELLDLAITAGIRLLKVSPVLTIVISALTAGFTGRNEVWQ